MLGCRHLDDIIKSFKQLSPVNIRIISTGNHPDINLISTITYTLLEEPELDAADAPAIPAPASNVLGVGQTYVNNMWYFAVAGSSLKPGKMMNKTIMGRPILIGRDSDGNVFAMEDICPHQGVRLSTGCFDGKEVECCFHGWRFNTKGVCTEIPSLCSDQKVNVCNNTTRSYPCEEVQGSIWIYFGKPLSAMSANVPAIPTASGIENLNCDQTTTTLLMPVHIDFSVLALMDVAHTPFVHNAWWWRSKRSLKEKTKHYVPSENGFTMVKHKPSKHSLLFKLFGDYLETEISFRLPGCRREHVTFNGRTIFSGITTCTPIDEFTTEMNHTTYWSIPFLKPIIEPIVQYFVYAFLEQDQVIHKQQEELRKYNPKLSLTIKDAGTPGNWYFQLKRAWNEATENDIQFLNPVKEKTLRWRT